MQLPKRFFWYEEQLKVVYWWKMFAIEVTMTTLLTF